MKRFSNLMICLSLLLFASCSFLTKYSILTIKDSGHWKKSGTCEECESYESPRKFKYQYNKSTTKDLSVSVCPCIYGLAISFGPPFVPVIPNFVKLLKHKWKNQPFYADILFGNFKGKRIDIASVKFIFSDKNAACRADSILLLSEGRSVKRKFIRTGREKSKRKIADTVCQFDKDTVRLRFCFSLPMNKIQKFSVDFSGFRVDDTIVPFSKIDYVKSSRFIYDPFVTGY
ncbi:MAG: hypothetical protein WCK34_04015 [Bacteroidota bacterium]